MAVTGGPERRDGARHGCRSRHWRHDGGMGERRAAVWIPADREWRRNMTLQTGAGGFLYPAAALALLETPVWMALSAGLVCMVAAIARCRVAGLRFDPEGQVLVSRGWAVTRRVPYGSISCVDVGGSPFFQGALTTWGSHALHLTVDGRDVVLPSTNTRDRGKAFRRAKVLHGLVTSETAPDAALDTW